MISLAPSFEGHRSDRTLAPARELTPDVLKRRVIRRRQMLTIQAASYALNSAVLLIYAYAGALSIAVPSTYFLASMMLTGFFAALSETHINDRFEDHYLTTSQIAANITLQLVDWSTLSAGMTVTISAGVASLVPDEAPDALLARADCALYAAKERGRNRIACA
jgi:uncharacterized membrane protein YiaA